MTSTLAAIDADFTRWHGGCRTAAVWVVEVDTPEVRAAVEAMRECLSDLLLPRYERQPHVTVAFGGLLPEPGTAPTGVLYPEDLQELHAARIAELDVAPFTVRAQGWGLFTSVPYLAVSAPELAALHEALIKERPANADFAPDYVTHITAGHFGVEVPLAVVRDRLRNFDYPAIDLPINHLTLAHYATSDIAGPLSCGRRVPFIRQPTGVGVV